MDTKPWYTSKILWSSVIAILAWVTSFTGHHMDTGTQQVLVSQITNAADAIGPLASTLILYFRTKPTPPLTLKKDTP